MYEQHPRGEKIPEDWIVMMCCCAKGFLLCINEVINATHDEPRSLKTDTTFIKLHINTISPAPILLVLYSGFLLLVGNTTPKRSSFQDKVLSFFVSLELFIPFYYIAGMYTTWLVADLSWKADIFVMISKLVYITTKLNCKQSYRPFARPGHMVQNYLLKTGSLDNAIEEFS